MFLLQQQEKVMTQFYGLFDNYLRSFAVFNRSLLTSQRISFNDPFSEKPTNCSTHCNVTRRHAPKIQSSYSKAPPLTLSLLLSGRSSRLVQADPGLRSECLLLGLLLHADPGRLVGRALRGEAHPVSDHRHQQPPDNRDAGDGEIALHAFPHPSHDHGSTAWHGVAGVAGPVDEVGSTDGEEPFDGILVRRWVFENGLESVLGVR